MEILISSEIDTIGGAWGWRDAVGVAKITYELQNWVASSMTSTGQGPFGQSTGNDFFDAMNGGNLGA